jgi:hypothetical protein
MATALNFDTVKKHVVAILQASQTAYGAGTTGNAPDGSNQMFPSSEEINNAILGIDGEVCTAIASTVGHPYAPQFSLETAALASGAQVTKNVGVVQKVTVLNGIADEAFSSAGVNITDNTIGISGTNLVTGTKVRLTTAGVLPTGLAISTDYWVIRVNANTIQLASTVYNAQFGIPIDLTGAGSGNSTIVIQYVDGIQAQSKDEVLEINSNPQVFGSLPGYVTGFWFIEDNCIYCTSPLAKVTYTDYTLTSSPQAPESYIWAVIAGAVSVLAKDGFDAQLSSYYGARYAAMIEQIRANVLVMPVISQYKAVGV